MVISAWIALPVMLVLIGLVVWMVGQVRDYDREVRREQRDAELRKQSIAAKRAVNDITTRAQTEMLRLLPEGRSRQFPE